MGILQTDITFIGHAAGFRDKIDNLNLQKVWSIEPHELSPIAVDSLKVLNELSQEGIEEYKQVVWVSQALIEFQDLQPYLLPEHGPFLKVHFAFLESLAAMRSSILSALGGNLHAALAVLRSSVELFIYHYWWRNRLEEEKSFHAFYSWLNAEKASPPFKQILTDVYKKLDLPLEAYGKDDIYKGYKKLCSYVHKPTIQESVTRIRRSNSTIVSHDELYYWLNLLLQVQRPLLDLAIAHAPQALFPVAIYRKFGFNIPIGTLFDESNFIPVQEAIGPSKVLAYQEHYKRNRSVKELLHWVNNRTDLSDEEILNTWSDDPINDADLDFSERVFHRATMVKARMRALMVGFVYASMDAELFAVDMENDNERKFKKFKQRN